MNNVLRTFSNQNFEYKFCADDDTARKITQGNGRVEVDSVDGLCCKVYQKFADETTSSKPCRMFAGKDIRVNNWILEHFLLYGAAPEVRKILRVIYQSRVYVKINSEQQLEIGTNRW